MNLEKVISIALFVPMENGMGLPCLFEGPPGVGKSSRAKAASKARKLPFHAVYMPTKQPEDLTSLPVPDGKGGVTFVCGLPAIRELNALGRGVLLFDEINWAPRSVQAACLSVFLERQIGDIQIAPGVRLLLAGNSAEEGDGGHSMLTTLANRVAYFRVPTPSADEFIAYRQGLVNYGEVDVDDCESEVKAAWPDVFPRIDGLVCGFVKRKSEMLHKQPPQGSKERHRAWPSPRSWETAARAAATCRALGEKNLEGDFMAAIVGEAAASEFATYVDQLDLPDPAEMIRDGWTPDKRRLDKCVAAYTSLAAHVISRSTDKEKFKAAAATWRMFKQADEAGLADLVVNPMRVLAKGGLSSKCADKSVAEAAKPLILKLGDLKLVELSAV